MDYIFPLDSSLFKHEEGPILFSFFNMEKIKRVHSITDNEKKEVFCMQLDDINPTPSDSYTYCSKNQLEYLLLWLESLGCLKAIAFRDKLLEYKKKLTLSCYSEYILEYKRPPPIDDHLDNTAKEQTQIPQKYWIKRINNVTRDWIKTKPYFIRVNRVSGANKIHKVVKIYVNHILCNLTKTTPKLTNIGNTGPFGCIKTYDFIGMFMIKFNQPSSNMETEGLEEPLISFNDTMFLTDKDNNLIKGKFVLFNEKYVFKGDVYSKSTVVFV